MESSEPEYKSVEDFLKRATRRQKRMYLRAKKKDQDKWPFPDFMKGLSNHQRMVIKKVGRAGQETKSRSKRNSQYNSTKEDS